MQTKAKPIEGVQGMENLLTTAQVASLRGVGASTVYRAIGRGKLAAAALHGRMYIERREAEAWQPLTDNAARAKKAGETRWAKAKNTAPNSPTSPAEAAQAGQESED